MWDRLKAKYNSFGPKKYFRKGVSWISSHPIAGTEESGPESGFSEAFSKTDGVF